MLIDLINCDTKSLLSVLIWGNTATGIIVYLYRNVGLEEPDRRVMRSMTIIRFLFAVAYFLLLQRESIPDVISVNAGNTLLFVCFYMEARVMLEIGGETKGVTTPVLTSILICSIVMFNVSELYYSESSLRVALSSLSVFMLFLVPAGWLMFSNSASAQKRRIGIYYLVLLLALIPRIVVSFANASVNIHTNDYYHTLVFLMLILMMISNTVVYLLFMKEQTNLLIEKMATFDHLTSIMNRRSFHLRGGHVFENHKISRGSLALLFLDIDRFKAVNDNYGHQFGDEVLVRFTEIIMRSIRPSDICCRYGGEEFIVLLSGAGYDIGQKVGERIMRETEKAVFDDRPGFHVTTSVGCMSGSPMPGDTLEEYIRNADAAMYEAKRTGRNRLVSYWELAGKTLAEGQNPGSLPDDK